MKALFETALLVGIRVVSLKDSVEDDGLWFESRLLVEWCLG